MQQFIKTPIGLRWIIFLSSWLISYSLFAKTIPNEKWLHQLNQLLQEKEIYTQQKRNTIKEIQKMLEVPNISLEQRYSINKRLFDEFKTFISDSAMYYVKENIKISQTLDNQQWWNDSQLDLASLYSISGNYLDAADILHLLPKESFSTDLLIRYYSGHELLYNNYAFNNPNADLYKEKANQYRDSLLGLLDTQSTHYHIVLASILSEQNQLDKAKEILLKRIEPLPDNHEKAVLTYMLATIYQKEKNTEKQIEYFAISASCDIKNAIKENTSLRILATTLFEMGEIEIAYRYIKSAMEDAIFCNSKLRSGEAMQLFPIIEAAYQDTIHRQNNKLWQSLALVAVVSVFLIVAIIFVYRQMKRIAKIRKELYHKNLDLENLNENLQEVVHKLNQTNKQLHEVNAELLEANGIKETYIAQFFNLCSIYIDKMEKFQHTLTKKAKDRNIDELMKILRSTEMIEQEHKELYRLFDEIFLHLYPTFISEFNNLLAEDERFELKPNEMNPELRIFALIRLGISDSAKIASFLHYSTNTIYSYRTRVRNKSVVPREEFENYVMKIAKNSNFY